ncbi:MAG: hypothetical protein HY598_00685 [Candidatus Omnitrophica bacterium]|nr:hypothetical protein [Candidatus Omnitrophota bacterium]
MIPPPLPNGHRLVSALGGRCETTTIEVLLVLEVASWLASGKPAEVVG